MTPSPFNRCSTKLKARRVTIVEPWRALSRRQAIPRDSIYVTLAGPLRGGISEYEHMIAEGLIRPHQFHGVECNEAVHCDNLEVVANHPEHERPTLHHGDLVKILDQMIGSALNPAIVNVDLMVGPKKGIPTLIWTLSALKNFPGPKLVLWNVVLAQGRHQLDSQQDYEDVVLKNPHLQYVSKGWCRHGKADYQRRTYTMRTTIWWRAS